MKTHKELSVFKDSMELATAIYQLTNQFPKSEIYGLTSQMRRSAFSIPLNIAEGSGRIYTKETIHFLNFALGSATELDTQLDLSFKLNFIRNDQHEHYICELTKVTKMLQGYLKYHKGKLHDRTI
ncbi:MAG: four helix bundle protein [Flavobacteriales bacterium]